MFRIITMLKYGTRRVEIVPFNCHHDPILRDAKIHSLCHLPLYLAHVTHATRTHTTPNKNCTTSMFNYMTHMISLYMRFSIPHQTPNATIRLKSIDLSLITKNHPIPIMDSPILMMLSKFQLAIHILGREQWLHLLL